MIEIEFIFKREDAPAFCMMYMWMLEAQLQPFSAN